MQIKKLALLPLRDELRFFTKAKGRFFAILVGFWGKGEGERGKEKTFNLYPVGELVEPLTFSPNPMPS
ncbi:hypothetical protein [Nostoc sp. CCY 9925]|uniref:hypothetical protein n=1 Tax=Nostoc sp. CCY 9925 TaxID=3103865 RepID=UPI0039C72A8A